jgi:phospholipase/carboxylesterase
MHIWMPAGPRRTVVTRRAWTAALVALAAVVLAGDGYTGQAGGQGRSEFDPAKKGTWRFLDDDLQTMLLDAAAAYRKADYRTAARHYLAYLYRNGRDVEAMYTLARCYARLGDADAAVGVLTRAAWAGFVRPDALQNDKDFDPIRDSRIFRDHQKTIGSIADTIGQTILVSGPRANRCRIRLPASYAAGTAYPLVIGLHGYGGNAHSLMSMLPPDALAGMICAALEGAYPRTDASWVPNQQSGWYYRTEDRALWPLLDPLTSDYILNVIDEISRRHRVSHVILLGCSQGVSVAYLTALKHPGRVTAVVAFAGVFPQELVTPEEVKAASNLRVLIVHGTADREVAIQTSEGARDRLKQAGYRVQYETFEGGHDLSPEMVRRAGEWIRSWLPGGQVKH